MKARKQRRRRCKVCGLLALTGEVLWIIGPRRSVCRPELTTSVTTEGWVCTDCQAMAEQVSMIGEEYFMRQELDFDD